MSTSASPIQTPVIQGNQANFLWFGARAPVLVGDFNHWQTEAPIQLTLIKPGVWRYSLALPMDAYIEYAFLQEGQLVRDPNNPRLVWNGYDAENHYFYMPQAGPTLLAKKRRGSQSGKVISQMLEGDSLVIGGRRKVYFYQPQVSKPVPLVIVFDGGDYLRRACLTTIVDNLIDNQRIEPVALALVHSSRSSRGVEYASNDATLAFLIQQVIPAAQDRLNLINIERFPGAFGVMGASMGGVMALFSAIRLPHIFGKVLSQSGGFEAQSTLVELIRLGAPRPVQIWMDAGFFDFLLEDNRAMFELLTAEGYACGYHEYPGGHNYTAWRDDLWRGLEHLFPFGRTNLDTEMKKGNND